MRFFLPAYYLLLCILIFLTPDQSVAEESQQTKLSKAQRLIEEGSEFFKRKEYQRGIEAYEEAQRVIPDMKNLFVIATAYGYLPQHCKATLDAWATFFKRCNKSCRYLQNGLEKYEQQRARCLITFKVSSPTPGLMISYAGEQWGVTPGFSKELIAGEYPNVTFSAPGFHPYTQDISLKPEQGAFEVSVSLVPILSPSFIDQNRTLLGGITGAFALSSLFYALNQMATYQDSLENAKRIENEVLKINRTQMQTYRDLNLEFNTLQTRAESAQTMFWIGMGGALVFGSLSAWIWFKEADVIIDPSLKPSMQPVSSLHWLITPWHANLSFGF